MLHTLPNLTNCDMQIPYVGTAGILLLILYGKPTLGKLKLSLLSYTVVMNCPLIIITPTSKYETMPSFSVVFLRTSSDGHLLHFQKKDYSM